MEGDISLNRGWKTFGFAGPVAFILVWLAANTRGSFDVNVFILAFSALALCWARTWVLVPLHEVLQARNNAEWDRYTQYDWHLLEVFSEMTGAEIDQLRHDVAGAKNDAVQATLQKKAPHWDPEDRTHFLEYFVTDLSDIDSVYIDPDGKLQAFD